MKRFIKRKIHKIFFIMACAALLFGMHLGYSIITSSLAVDGNIKLKQGMIDVSLEQNNGYPVVTIRYKSNEKYGYIQKPTKINNDFIGWFTEDEELITSTTNVIQKNHTLYAKYQEIIAPIISIKENNNNNIIIHIDTEGSAFSGIKYYEYFITQNNITPTNATQATGNTNNELEITEEGRNYIYYRTVSNDLNKSEWSNLLTAEIILNTSCVDKWKCFLDAGGFNYNNYTSLEEAMDDINVYNYIFSNKKAMTYLVENLDLILELKNLTNYSTNIVPNILESVLYTEKQKYEYSLPFYLYNEGTIDSNVYANKCSSGGGFCTPTTTCKNNSNGYLQLSINSKSNCCAGVAVGSSKQINTTNYVNLGVSISDYSFVGNLSTYGQIIISLSANEFTYQSASLTIGGIYVMNQFKGNGNFYVDIKQANSDYYPFIRKQECNSELGPYTVSFNINRWWVE